MPLFHPLQKAFDDNSVLGMLSNALEIDVRCELYMDFLWSEVHALRTAPEPLLRSICQTLSHSYHVPGDVVMAKGDLAKYMHITREGELAVYDNQGRYIRSICEGDVFGHEGLLAKGTGQKGQCQYTVVCEAHCETLTMDQEGSSPSLLSFQPLSLSIFRKPPGSPSPSPSPFPFPCLSGCEFFFVLVFSFLDKGLAGGSYGLHPRKK